MHPELNIAMKSVFEASRYLVWWCNHPQKALEIVKPFQSLNMPAGVEKDKYDKVMSFVMATIGDCYFTMKEPAIAAEWYRKAANYNKCGGYPSFYADIVLKNNLKDHYQVALECIEANNANWRRQPIFTRVIYSIISRWWLHPYLWRLYFIQHRFADLLRERISMENISQ